MGIDAFLNQMARNPRLPTPPAVALRVFKEAARPDCSLGEIASILKHDPGFCARLLKIVNSSYYGATRSVTSIDRALSLLGLQRVRSLALGLSLPAMQRRKASDPAMQSFWATAVAEAVAARQWAETARLPDPDNEMVAALLCDIGSLLLMEACPEKYEAILREKPEVLVHTQCELEEKVFGFNHAQLGAEMLQRWGLPEDITEAIRYHHYPERAAGKAGGIGARALRLHLASCIAQMQLAPADTELFTQTLRLAKDHFQLSEQQMVAWLEPLNAQIDELARLMQVETAPCQHYPTLLANHMESLAQLASEMALENLRAEERMSQAELELQIGEEELQRLGREHALILNTAAEGIYGVDAQGRLTFVNPAAARMVGWTAAELIGRAQQEALQPRRSDGRPARWEESVLYAVLRDGLTRRVESDIYWRRDGSSFPVMYVCAPIVENGVVLGAVVTCRDVTEQKCLEYERDCLFTLSPDLLCLAGHDRVLTRVNPAWEQLLGYPLEELAGRCLDSLVHPDDREQTRRELDRLAAGAGRVAVENRLQCKDGSYRWFLWSATPFLTAGVFYAAGRDMTEKRQAEEALRRSEEQLRQVQKMEAVGSLAGGVAHDFNNLLTIINGYSELLESFDLPEAAREVLAEIRKAGERSERLTRQLLTLCRRQVLDPRLMDLNAAVRDVEKMLHRLIGEDIKLSSELAEDLGCIKADLGQIQQVLLNLAVNARDAMPRGGSLTIQTANIVLDEGFVRRHSGLRPGAYVRLTVTDTGCGMDEATRLRIFEPFFTTKGPGKGTGLGLSTVFSIVEQAGGAVEVASEPGKGACFQIYLPCVEARSGQGTIRVVEQGDTRPRKEATILLIEDEEAVRSLMCNILGNSHYRVLSGRDGAQALRLAESRGAGIDLLITDVVMPDMSGTELAEQLAKRFAGLKVLYVSGYPDDAVVRHGLGAQETAFLQKPFSQKDLLRKVDAILACSGSEAEQEWESVAPSSL